MWLRTKAGGDNEWVNVLQEKQDHSDVEVWKRELRQYYTAHTLLTELSLVVRWVLYEQQQNKGEGVYLWTESLITPLYCNAAAVLAIGGIWECPFCCCFLSSLRRIGCISSLKVWGSPTVIPSGLGLFFFFKLGGFFITISISLYIVDSLLVWLNLESHFF